MVRRGGRVGSEVSLRLKSMISVPSAAESLVVGPGSVGRLGSV